MVQSVIMIIIAAVMFVQYYYSRQIIFLALMAFAMAFVAIYFYRIFIMRVIFDIDKVTFKGLKKEYIILKKDIFDIQLIKQVGREVNTTKYIKGGNYSDIGSKSYVMIRKNGELMNTNLSMFNAATENYIVLEFVPGIEEYLDKLLEK